MKIYTKTGDQGATALYTGERIAKDDVRVEAYGTVDELDAALGLARVYCRNCAVRETVLAVQQTLPRVMAEIASLGGVRNPVNEQDIAELEMTIDRYEALLPPLTQFVIPGDNQSSAALHVARTVTRRAERQLWRLSRQEKLGDQLLILFNRLSDLCFVLARVESNEGE